MSVSDPLSARPPDMSTSRLAETRIFIWFLLFNFVDLRIYKLLASTTGTIVGT